MDQATVVRAQRGDHEAFESLAADAVDRLYALARLILRDPDLADDATQEALFRAWRDLPSLRAPDRWDAWVRRLLVHACMDEARKRRRFEASVTAIAFEPATDDAVAQIADRDRVARGLARLTVEQRTALVLRYHLGLSVPEVADALRVPVGTAKSRIHYAMDALRASLDADNRVGRREATA